MKVALMTIFQVPNYGSVLQTFATQKVLEKLGYECDVINYNYPNEWHFRHGFVRPSRLKAVLKGVLNMFGLHVDKFKSGIERFRRQYLNLTRLYTDLDDLSRADWTPYCALITGSDQVWNPRFLKGDSAFMLSFCDAGVRKISISSSFACRTLPSGVMDKYKKYIGAYSSISVREDSGLDILRSQLGLGTPACVMLDPTLLLSADNWERELQLDFTPGYGKYLLLYILDYAFDPRPQILEIAGKLKEEYDCDYILTFSKLDSEEVMKLGAVSVDGSSVEEFVNYFRHAAVVVTSSFHGTAFAINFSRPFISVCPEQNDERQSGLLRLLGIPENGIHVGQHVKKLCADYDSGAVHEKLSAQRKSLYEWIANALS